MGPDATTTVADEAPFDVKAWDLVTFFYDYLTDEDKLLMDEADQTVDPGYVSIWDPEGPGETLTQSAYCYGVSAETVTPALVSASSWYWDQAEAAAEMRSVDPGIAIAPMEISDWVSSGAFLLRISHGMMIAVR